MDEKTILIVDDDEDLQILYGLYLRGESYRIERAYNGQEALEKVEKNKPDLIILDIIMPVMDGEEFFTKLRVEKNIRDIPVIVASVNEKISPKLFKLGGIHSTLQKPFSIDTLVGKVRDALSHQ
ncbi:MAG: response regulator [Candidatus Omnitrophica bacterium]|nr:response regulator [Candidatus Omnitrophota bacterium]